MLLQFAETHEMYFAETRLIASLQNTSGRRLGFAQKINAALHLFCLQIVYSLNHSMNVAVFSTKSYDREFLDRFNMSRDIQLTYFEAPLNKDTVKLTQGFEAVCVFVNDKIDG